MSIEIAVEKITQLVAVICAEAKMPTTDTGTVLECELWDERTIVAEHTKLSPNINVTKWEYFDPEDIHPILKELLAGEISYFVTESITDDDEKIRLLWEIK